MMIGTLINALSPRCFPMSCLLESGELNQLRWDYYTKKIAAYGGHLPGIKNPSVYVRVFPWLGIDRKMFPDEPLEGNMNHYPWKFDFQIGKFDFESRNDLFYENLDNLFRIANQNGLIVKYTILDRCHMNNKKVPETPFFKNKQGIYTVFDKKGFPYIKRYIQKVLNIAKNRAVRWEPFNEPRQENNIVKPVINLLLEKLRLAKIPISHIELGKELMVLKTDGLHETGYVGLRHALDFNDGLDGGFATIHNLDAQLLYAKAAPKYKNPEKPKDDWWMNELFNHKKRVAIKTDGSPQNKDWWETEFLKFLQIKKPNKRKSLKYMDLEATYFGKGPGYETYLNEIKGIAECLHEYTGKWPGGQKPTELNIKDPGINPPKKEVIIMPEKPEKPTGPIVEEKPKKSILQWIKKRHRVLIGALVILLSLVFGFFGPRWAIVPILAANHLPWKIGFFQVGSRSRSG